MIRSGEFAEGDALPSERDLMSAFGVGRPSIRDALSALARKGLVKISSGERTRVTRPTADHIIFELSGMSLDILSQPGGLKNFDQLRQFFESSLVRYAAEFATAEQLSNLEAALALNEKAIGRDEQFMKTDINFHRVIAEIPGNPIFMAVHEALANWVIAARPAIPDAERHNQGSFQAHRDIFQAIRDRDIAGADYALKIHLQNAYDIYYGDTQP
ncbi:MAG: transcriptional regulator NanR [Halioglobus sp.]